MSELVESLVTIPVVAICWPVLVWITDQLAD